MQRFFILCEGKSEEKYIQSIRRLMANWAIDDILLIPKCFGGGKTFPALKDNIKHKMKEIREDKINLNDEIFVWLDKDVFLREYVGKFNELKKEIENIKTPKSCKFIFNHMNFEDFLILHYENDCIINLQTKLYQKNHFELPLVSAKYLEVFSTVIHEYTKGYLPENFNLSLEKLQLCVKNIEDKNVKFNSDMIKILKLIIQKCEE